MRTALLLVVALIAPALGVSYYTASIGPLLGMMDREARSEPDCDLPVVVAALNRSLDNAKAGRHIAALVVAQRFNVEDPSHFQRQMKYAERIYWLRVMADRDRLASAYCALGNAGRDYNLPQIGARVGVRDIAHADPHTLQALTDLYANDIRYRIPTDRMRRLFHARLR